MELTLQSDELFQVMKVHMTTEQEQIFMASHYLYLQHGADSTKFVVDFDDVWKNVDFTQKANAKRLLEKHFTYQIDYAIVFFPKEELLRNQVGGRPKETIMLTVDCFKSFCMIASTPKAKTIRSYYIKMENIMHEYYKNFKTKNDVLQNTLQQSQNALQLSQIETAIKRHEVLIESNKNKWVVYFCRIRLNDDGSFILKIGESTDIKNRIEALSCDFDTSIVVLDVFNCENSLRFERFLHNSKELIKYKYNNLEHKNKTLSTEAYHIPTYKEYEKLIKFTKSELSKYNSTEMLKLRVEEKRIDLITTLCKNYDEAVNLLNKITSPVIELPQEFITVSEEPAQEYAEEQPQTGPTSKSTGPIVQLYHKDNLHKVVQVFGSIIEATRDFNYNNTTASFSCVKKANKHKTVYLDHRWHFISNRQEIDLHKPRDIGETVITQERKQGQIAMLNIDKTKIINVFKMAKEAAKSISQHPSAMCSAIKYVSPLNNHYWLLWENVSVSLRNDFLESNILPVRPKNIRGIKIELLHPTSNEVVKTFDSYTEVQKELRISVRKVKELIENAELYKGKYRFKFCS